MTTSNTEITQAWRTSGAGSSFNARPIVYPEDLFSRAKHFCQITVLRKITGNQPRRNPGDISGRTPLAYIYLPIPMNFTEGTFVQEFEPTSVFEQVLSTGQDIASLAQIFAVGNEEGRAGSLIRIATGIGAAATAGVVVGEVGERAINLFGAQAQNVLNRGYYVAYKQPKNREFEFAWMLHPKNRNDSANLSTLNTWLKYFSSATLGGGNGENPNVNEQAGFMIGFPNEMRIRMLHIDSDSNVTPIFKPEMHFGYVQQLQIEHFDESGQPVGFFTNTKYPTVTLIKMSFLENRMIFKNDFVDTDLYDSNVDSNILRIPTGLDSTE